MLFFLLLGAVTIFLANYRSELKKTARAIYQELMEVKEEATGKVKRIEELNNSLERVVAKLKNEEDQVYQKTIEEYSALMQALNLAHKHMTDWMSSLNPAWDKRTPQEAVAYLKEEQEKIQRIDEKAEKAIKEAEEALDSRGELATYREDKESIMNEKHECCS